MALIFSFSPLFSVFPVFIFFSLGLVTGVDVVFVLDLELGLIATGACIVSGGGAPVGGGGGGRVLLPVVEWNDWRGATPPPSISISTAIGMQSTTNRSVIKTEWVSDKGHFT